MKREGHESAQMFIAGEVEKTPAFGKKTLFVVGFQDINEIKKYAKDHKVQHIFLGANHSFNATYKTDHISSKWDEQISELLDSGYTVTLDYQAHQHKTVLTMLRATTWQNRNFIPLLSVRIPHIETSSPNLTVKIDDVDFKATNPGVWCMHFREVTDSNRFTDWQDYESDEIIASLNAATGNESEVRQTFQTNIGDLPPKEALTKVKELINEAKERKTMHLNHADTPPEDKVADLNDSNLGIDIKAKSSLKPETDTAPLVAAVTTPEQAADLYTAGTTKDPLSAKDLIQRSKIKK